MPDRNDSAALSSHVAVNNDGVTCMISYRWECEHNHVAMQGYLGSSLSALGVADRRLGHDNYRGLGVLEKKRLDKDVVLHFCATCW